MARKRKPTSLKILNGNPGKRPLPTNEATPEKMLSKAPGWLDRYAKKAWDDLAPRLYKLNLLTELDLCALTMLCCTYSQWLKAQEDIVKRGLIVKGDKGALVKNPSLSIARSCHDQLHRLMSEFGLTPSSRASIPVGLAPNSSGNGSSWDDLLR